MGYTTSFQGELEFSKPLTVPQYHELVEFNENRHDDTKPVTGYCQWVPTSDGKGLRWDGGEKFYNYVEWLQWLIDNKFSPWGIMLKGEIKWEGEDHTDHGIIKVHQNKVEVEELQLVGAVTCPNCNHTFVPEGTDD